MIGVVVVTHCHLGEELIAAAKLVVGRPETVSCGLDRSEGRVGRNPGEDHRCDPKGRRRKRHLDPDRYVRRNPSNISLSFLEERRIEVITGVNLPMLLKLATYLMTWISKTWPFSSPSTGREISIWPVRSSRNGSKKRRLSLKKRDGLKIDRWPWSIGGCAMLHARCVRG
jgi:PTS system mannose-specific IIA component